MFYEGELRILCDTFKKCRVPVHFVTAGDALRKVVDESFQILFNHAGSLEDTFAGYISKIQPYTIYKSVYMAHLHYVCLLLPQTEPQTLLLLGPYVIAPLPRRQLLEIGERYGVLPHQQKLLEEYYSGLPVLADSNPLFMLLESFGERIWGSISAFSMVELTQNTAIDATPLQPGHSNPNAEDVLVNMEIMEKRYAFENELMQAVTRGQVHKAALIVERFSEAAFEQRVADPVRNLKNYCIIMNTLLRKAAEQGGVHPLYINEISSSFAYRLEQLTTSYGVQALMSEMFRGYCRLVRKHSMKNYSSTVQKVILYIDSDLSANLSPARLAQLQSISPGYLSAVFKKETGQTLTAYILDRRMQLAAHLLRTTRLQIQTVALHCGIMDVQYFSKLFKKHHGQTPKAYRENAVG